MKLALPQQLCGFSAGNLPTAAASILEPRESAAACGDPMPSQLLQPTVLQSTPECSAAYFSTEPPLVHGPGPAAQTTLLPLSYPESTRKMKGRSHWSPEEDKIIMDAVSQMGFAWRKIAKILRGRSEDSVRGRWTRLQRLPETDKLGTDLALRRESNQSTDSTVSTVDHRSSISQTSLLELVQSGDHQNGSPVVLSPSSRIALPVSDADTKFPDKATVENIRDQARVGWTAAEDSIILDAVKERGHKWGVIAKRLNGRTAQATRNRFNRLLLSK